MYGVIFHTIFEIKMMRLAIIMGLFAHEMAQSVTLMKKIAAKAEINARIHDT